MQIAGLGTRGTGTCGTGTAGLGHALQGQFVCFLFFVIGMLKEKIIFLCDCMYVIIIVVTNRPTTVESLR